MTSLELPDWASSVGIIDQAKTLAATTLAAGSFIGPLDTSQLSSMTINLTLISGSGAERMQLSLDWQEANTNVATDYMTYSDGPAYGGAFSLMEWQVPVRGSSVFIRARGTNVAPQTIVVVGSTRSIPSPILVPRVTGNGGAIGQMTGRFLLDTGAQALAAGATSARFYVPPVARRIAVRCNQTVPSISVQLDGLFYFAGAMAVAPFQYLNPISGQPLAVELDCPGQGLELTLFNGDAAAHSTHAYVWDVS